MKDPGTGNRVFKDAADEALQKKMEGKDTPFQRALRAAEQVGEKSFTYKGKSYAAKPKPQPAVVRAKMSASAPKPPVVGEPKMMAKKKASADKKPGLARMTKKGKINVRTKKGKIKRKTVRYGSY